MSTLLAYTPTDLETCRSVVDLWHTADQAMRELLPQIARHSGDPTAMMRFFQVETSGHLTRWGQVLRQAVQQWQKTEENARAVQQRQKTEETRDGRDV